ncbi:MAG TPA: alcohol dehydrogenase catalytic domain-containing protein [Spirochaetales bacterium]|nr:alcohol dehydrogenase catalytic domain-containing protein [Spirochaetales bacterium]
MAEKRMKAIRLNAPNNFEYCDVPVPEIESHEVLARVETVSICGTDPHIFAGEYPGYWPKSFPLIPGHEWSGTIVKVGEAAKNLGWKEGERICGISHVGCGYCAMCLKGRYNLCLNYGHEEKGHRQYGHYSQGAYAQYIATSVKSIARIPDSMSFDVAACMDPFSIALHAVERSDLEPGDSVLVNGSGAQGLMSIMIVRAMGAGKVIASGSGFRLQVAQQLGAIPVNYKSEDVVARVKELTGDLGVTRVIECSGTPEGVRQACEAVAKGGTISMISLPSEDVEIPIRRLVLDEVEIKGNRANPNTLEPAIAMVQENHLDLGRLITHSFPLSKFAEAFDIFVHRKDNSLKVVVKPNA